MTSNKHEKWMDETENMKFEKTLTLKLRLTIQMPFINRLHC